MSKQNTRATIDANIKQNGQQQITGAILNSVLNTMVTDYAEQEKLTDLERKVGETKDALSSVEPYVGEKSVAISATQFSNSYIQFPSAWTKGKNARITIKNGSTERILRCWLGKGNGTFLVDLTSYLPIPIKANEVVQFEYLLESDDDAWHLFFQPQEAGKGGNISVQLDYYESYGKLNELDENIIVKRVVFDAVASGYQTITAIDLAQANKLRVYNPSANAISFWAVLYRDGQAVQYLGGQSAPAGGYAEWSIPNVNDNIDSWLGGNSYNTFEWTLGVSNPSAIPATVDVYYPKTNQHIAPIALDDNVICVSPTGDNGAFKNIQRAIEFAKAKFDVSTTPVTIYIKNGTYTFAPIANKNCVIDKGSNRISIIGESRDGVQIILNSTPALNNKVLEIGGPCLIANLTIKNLWTADGSTFSSAHNAYCIHNDAYFASDSKYYTIIRNCYLYSEAFTPIGAGLKDKQTQVYEDCVFDFNSKTEAYNQHAPLYVHAPSEASARDCAIIVNNCTCIARGGTLALTLPDVAGSLSYKEIPVTIRRTILVTTGQYKTWVQRSSHNLTIDCALNNEPLINY